MINGPIIAINQPMNAINLPENATTMLKKGTIVVWPCRNCGGVVVQCVGLFVGSPRCVGCIDERVLRSKGGHGLSRVLEARLGNRLQKGLGITSVMTPVPPSPVE